MLNKFESEAVLEAILTTNKNIQKLEKRIQVIEELLMGYLSIMEQMNESVQILTGEVIEELSAQEVQDTQKDNELDILAIPETFKKGGGVN